MRSATIPGLSRYLFYENGLIRYQGSGAICPDHGDLKSGYRKIRLLGDDKRRGTYNVHRLIWQAFRGDILPGMQIDHLDGIRFNNHLSNLLMVTPAQNNRLKKQREASLFTPRGGRGKGPKKGGKNPMSIIRQRGVQFLTPPPPKAHDRHG